MVYDLPTILETKEDKELSFILLFCKEELQVVTDEALKRIRSGAINMEWCDSIIENLHDLADTASYLKEELEKEVDKII